MIIFSLITMRDLIRNYKLIIKGKNIPDSLSDSEYLDSSTSSPKYNSSIEVGEPRIFKQDYSSESENENNKKTTVNTAPLQPKRNQSTKPRNISLSIDKNDFFYEMLQHPVLTEMITENTKLLSSKRSIDDNCISSSHSQENRPHTHNSLVTIFAVWNTTMGSSLLAMAWGMEKAGLFPGILINLFIVGICLYSAYTLLKINENYGVVGQSFEVPELCRLLIGRWAEMLSKIFSLIVLIGGDIVYWILMSNFLYNFVVFLYSNFSAVEKIREGDVLCPRESNLINKSNLTIQTMLSSTFYQMWDLYSTVPVFLGFMMFPLLNLKNATFFAKFSSLGTLSVTYLIIFVAVKSFGWGVHIENWSLEFNIKSSFCVLSGMLTMSYFIHNIIISVMRNNKHQEHNGRDLTIAFILVAFTYIFLGVVFYISFPLKKSCIEDNLLNNFSKHDTMAVIARILLFFQLFTVFPFVTFMLRTEVLNCIKMICAKERLEGFSYLKTILINLNIVFICIIFACFLPRIGTLIRYTGALSGLIYIFVIPSLLKMVSLRKRRILTVRHKILYIGFMIFGAINLISQFFITE